MRLASAIFITLVTAAGVYTLPADVKDDADREVRAITAAATTHGEQRHPSAARLSPMQSVLQRAIGSLSVRVCGQPAVDGCEQHPRGSLSAGRSGMLLNSESAHDV